MKAGAILRKASEMVEGDKNKEHGEMGENHRNISTLWSAYLGIDITPRQAAVMMALLKIARTKSGSRNGDDYMDGAAYMGIAGQLSETDPT